MSVSWLIKRAVAVLFVFLVLAPVFAGADLANVSDNATSPVLNYSNESSPVNGTPANFTDATNRTIDLPGNASASVAASGSQVAGNLTANSTASIEPSPAVVDSVSQPFAGQSLKQSCNCAGCQGNACLAAPSVLSSNHSNNGWGEYYNGFAFVSSAVAVGSPDPAITALVCANPPDAYELTQYGNRFYNALVGQVNIDTNVCGGAGSLAYRNKVYAALQKYAGAPTTSFNPFTAITEVTTCSGAPSVFLNYPEGYAYLPQSLQGKTIYAGTAQAAKAFGYVSSVCPVVPSPTPTAKPTPKPSVTPTPTPTPKPTTTPTPTPTKTPTPKPSVTPSPTPTATPTPSISITSYSSTMQPGQVASLRWTVSGSYRETGVYLSYRADKTDKAKLASTSNVQNAYNLLFLPQKGVYTAYVQAYEVTSSGQTVTSDWKSITILQQCSASSLALLGGYLALSQGEIRYTIPTDAINLNNLGELGLEGFKFFTVGSCIDDGIVTIGCGIDAVSTIGLVVPDADVVIAAGKLVKLVEGAKFLKLIGTSSKFVKVIKFVKVESKGTVLTEKIVGAVDKGLVKLDFTKTALKSDFAETAKVYLGVGESAAGAGERAVTRLRASGATNDMLEDAIVKGSAQLEKTIAVGKWEKGTAYLGEGIEGSTGWGWKHLLSSGRNKQIQEALRLANSDSEVKAKIFDTLRTGVRVPAADGKAVISKVYPRIGGGAYKLEVVISESIERNTFGRIITAIPKRVA